MILAADPVSGALTGLGAGMVLVAIICWAALALLTVLWMLVPFAIFGIRSRLDRIARELEALRLTLVPAVQKPRKEVTRPGEDILVAGQGSGDIFSGLR